MKSEPVGAAERLHHLEHALDHARHLLPAQNPLDRFVHHNTLHAFEERPFSEAVIEAARTFGTEPFLSEAAYLDAWRRGRILDRDVEWAIARGVQPGPVAGVIDRTSLARVVMTHPVEPLVGEALDWVLTETSALSEPRPDLSPEARARLLGGLVGDPGRALRMLWQQCTSRREALQQPEPNGTDGARLRDQLVAEGLLDPDRLVHPVLIRWCAGYLDQGIAYWPMADRDQGFYRCFLAHFDQPVDLGRPWLGELREVVRRARAGQWEPRDLCVFLLERMGHPAERWPEVFSETLLALRGWTGMFERLRERPDTTPEVRLPTNVVEVLAIRLALDWSVASWIRANRVEAEPVEREPSTDPVWRLFHLAQAMGLGAHALAGMSDARVRRLHEEAASFDDVRRRRLWHEAYERRFRTETLDAIAVHVPRAKRLQVPEARVQCVFCIDDREESIRRHLEEVAPWMETLGVAGNYGIAMYYQGLEHGRPVALGPAGFEPTHHVHEVPRRGELHRSKWSGLLRHNLDVGSQTLIRGSLVTLGGVAASLPLTLRLLAPRLHARLTRRDIPAETDLEHDFTLEQRVAIVRGTLELMGLVRGFAPLILCLGHGSHSMNNPHEAAYNCGACGGGRGGPNARLFARFANERGVRTALAAHGIHIPDSTWFVGGYHDTADDAVALYDLDLVPATLRSLVDETRTALDDARKRDAHERCRRFESAPLDLEPEAALAHVEARAEDLAQPRPELGHCLNAICLVGRRGWSRGLFLDRRAFLVSYDPDVDPTGEILARLLGMVVPVGAGISLEYWFSVVDPLRYGCGSKLPHNVSGFVGVMDGHQSDLRTGLPWQMVELHEPVRLLCVVEAPPAALQRVAENDPAVGRAVVNGWVALASLDPVTGALQLFEDGAFRPWQPEARDLPIVASSTDWYSGSRATLPPASVLPGGRP